MADYFAVLKRTLSGFSDPKPQLRTKLYERARTTIKRQLEGRTPALSDEALTAELDKLEQAIADIESEYNPESAAVAVQAQQLNEPIVEPVSEPEPVDLPPLPLGPPEPVEVKAPVPAALPPAPMPDLEISIPLLEPEPTPEAVIETVAVEETLEPAVDPVDEWAKEFISTEPAAEPVSAKSTANVTTKETGLPPIPPITPAPVALPQAPDLPLPELKTPPIPEPILAPVEAPVMAQTPPVSPAPTALKDELIIPPAPGFGARESKRPKKRGWGKWLLALLIIALLGAAVTFGWDKREGLIERFGLSDIFENPTRPKPVKTISIKPDPEEPEAVVAPSVEKPKSEKRLTAEGEEVEPAVTLPAVVPQTPTPEPPAVQVTQPSLPVAQNAILYERGATSAENSIDTGRVVWSVVQEEPSAGLPKEPAIRGRVEIPSRKLILIMTIKRNGDKSLPASHIIELVFAVPDEFSGGAVSQINRFVFKESEQGRGEGLVAVPARIADGIFLVALNNLESSTKKNETLMLTRGWIDIPLQYRTGRRALITIEKGLPGEKIFKEAFAAWEKLK